MLGPIGGAIDWPRCRQLDENRSLQQVKELYQGRETRNIVEWIKPMLPTPRSVASEHAAQIRTYEGSLVVLYFFSHKDVDINSLRDSVLSTLSTST